MSPKTSVKKVIGQYVIQKHVQKVIGQYVVQNVPKKVIGQYVDTKCAKKKSVIFFPFFLSNVFSQNSVLRKQFQVKSHRLVSRPKHQSKNSLVSMSSKMSQKGHRLVCRPKCAKNFIGQYVVQNMTKKSQVSMSSKI